jgi:dihydroxy-acid dehydratase
MVGHVAPEAVRGGPIAAVRDGDIVRLDLVKRSLTVDIPDQEMTARLQSRTAPPSRVSNGVMGKYARLVSSAAQGAVTA